MSSPCSWIFPSDNDSFRYTVDALDHAIPRLPLMSRCASCAPTRSTRLGNGVVIGPGSPYRDAAAAEEVIRTAREKGIPLVGT